MIDLKARTVHCTLISSPKCRRVHLSAEEVHPKRLYFDVYRMIQRSESVWIKQNKVCVNIIITSFFVFLARDQLHSEVIWIYNIINFDFNF